MTNLETNLIIALSLVSLGLLISVVFNLAFIATALEDSHKEPLPDLEPWVDFYNEGEKTIVKEKVLQC